MPVGLSAASIFRNVAGTLAALWAMAGLANDYLVLSAIGPSVEFIVAAAANAFLAAGASLAFVNANGWRKVLLIALTCATAMRIGTAIGSGAELQQIVSAAIALVAIATAAMIGGRP